MLHHREEGVGHRHLHQHVATLLADVDVGRAHVGDELVAQRHTVRGQQLTQAVLRFLRVELLQIDLQGVEEERDRLPFDQELIERLHFLRVERRLRADHQQRVERGVEAILPLLELHRSHLVGLRER